MFTPKTNPKQRQLTSSESTQLAVYKLWFYFPISKNSSYPGLNKGTDRSDLSELENMKLHYVHVLHYKKSKTWPWP